MSEKAECVEYEVHLKYAPTAWGWMATRRTLDAAMKRLREYRIENLGREFRLVRVTTTRTEEVLDA